MTDGHELRGGGMLEEGECQAEEDKGEKKNGITVIV